MGSSHDRAQRSTADVARDAAQPARRRRSARLGLGQRQRRHRQDARADHARAAPAARRHQPERILCLTYTKAAAAEMSKRVFDTLARVGDAARRASSRGSSPSCSTGADARRRCERARARCSPSPSRRPAASRCRPSTPSASGCCSAFRSRPACRRASPSSTTRARARCCAKPIDAMLAEATAAAAGAARQRARRRPSPTPPTTASTSCCARRCASRRWLDAARTRSTLGDDDELRRGRGDLSPRLRGPRRTCTVDGHRQRASPTLLSRRRACARCATSWRRARPTTQKHAERVAAALARRRAPATAIDALRRLLLTGTASRARAC